MAILAFIQRFIEAYRKIFMAPKLPVASAWESMVCSAAEEREMKIDYDARVPLREGVTAEAIVSFVLQAAQNAPELKSILQRLMQDFHLQEREATRAIDRVLAGVVHASTEDPQWCPDPVRDPIAWQSYQVASADHSIVQAIYPTA